VVSYDIVDDCVNYVQQDTATATSTWLKCPGVAAEKLAERDLKISNIISLSAET